MNTTPPQASTAQAIYQFFGHPIVGIVGVGASVLGVLLAIYFYVEGSPKPRLTYIVPAARAAVVRASQSSALTIEYGNKPLTGDVTAAQIMFWNAGDRTIHRNDVLKPLHIFTQPATRILEVQLRKTSRDVVQLELDQSGLAHGDVTVRWNLLERNDGGVIQIIYSGDEKVDITADATVEGQVGISRVDFEPLQLELKDKERLPLWLGKIILGVLFIPIGIMFVSGSRQLRLGQRANGLVSIVGATLVQISGETLSLPV
jgi:hypothetical protein